MVADHTRPLLSVLLCSALYYSGVNDDLFAARNL